MRRLLLITAFATSVYAHPSVSVVIDSHGNVYYSDLKQVWRLAPNGDKTIVVPNVHSHELYLDTNDNLYGEHLWYNGEGLNTWGSRVWRRSPDGRIVDVVPAHPGFNDRYSFVRDRAGNGYVADREHNEILRCAATVGPPPSAAAEGRGPTTCTTMARASFHDIRWMTVTAEGTVYLIDLVDLIRVTPDGRVTTLARDLNRHRERHEVQGLWTDRAGNVYVAVYGDREVKRIDIHGRVTVIARSSFPWSPTGGTIAPNGDLLLLENWMYDVRVRRIPR